MSYLKIALVSAGLLMSAHAYAGANVTGHSHSADSPFGVTGPAVEWSKAKDNCKKLGGKWKPIRKICKIDSITTPGL